MYQIDNSTSVAAQPASTSLGTPGYFTDGNPATGVPATIMPAEFMNAVMMEVLNVLAAAGITPAKNQFNQLAMAIAKIVQNGAAGAASESSAGILKLATSGLVAAGTDNTTAITPQKLATQIQSGALTAAIDTGTANTYVCAFTPAIIARSEQQVLRFKVKTANTGASTINDGVGVVPLVGGAHAPLQGGEMIVNGDAWVQWNSSFGGGAYVLLFCTGGAEQVAAATQSQHAAQLGQVGHGQCQLQIVSATSIKLAPLNGNNLIINSIPRQIPSAGVTLTNGGMNVNALYYIYAAWSGSSITLEFSATGHSTDTNGIEIKTGDSTRTLVGMVYVNASAQFSDGQLARLVASWFNRRSVGGGTTIGGTLTFTATTPTEISTAVRISFLSWANEAVDIKAVGQYTNNTATQSVSVTSYVDGAAYGNTCGSYVPAAGVGMSFATANSLTPSGSYLSEGFHIAEVFGTVTANTGSLTYMSHSLITRI